MRLRQTLISKAPFVDPVAGKESSTEPTRPARPPPPPFRQSFTRFLMIFLGLLAIWALFDPNLSQSFTSIANVVLGPLIGFGGLVPVVTILLTAVITTMISAVARDRFVDWAKVARINKVQSAWRKENMEALRKGNTAKVAKLKESYAAMQQDMLYVQTSQMKPTILTMFIFLVIFMWLRFFVDVTLTSVGNLWITVPWAANVYLPMFIPPFFTAWILFSIIAGYPISTLVTRSLKYVRFRRRLQAMGVSTTAEADQVA